MEEFSLHLPHLIRGKANKSDLLMKKLVFQWENQNCFVLDPHSFVIQWSHIILHKLLASPSIIKKDNFYKQIIQFYYPNKELSEIRKTLVNFCLIGSPQIHIKLPLWVYIKQFFSDNWNLMECLQTRWKNHPFNLMTTWKHFTCTDRMCPCCPPQDTAITMLCLLFPSLPWNLMLFLLLIGAAI